MHERRAANFILAFEGPNGLDAAGRRDGGGRDLRECAGFPGRAHQCFFHRFRIRETFGRVVCQSGIDDRFQVPAETRELILRMGRSAKEKGGSSRGSRRVSAWWMVAPSA